MKIDPFPSSETDQQDAPDPEQRRRDAAELVLRQRAALMRRIHALLGDGARKLTGTEDVLSTALRRIDDAILKGRLEASTDAQFYAFVHGVIERTILEKVKASSRASSRERTVQLQHGPAMVDTAADKSTLTREDVDRVSGLVVDPIDREIVFLKGRGLSLSKISEMMGMEAATVRQRWGRIRARVRSAILLERGDAGSE
jgi:DNA-directed RNA polymerase specialized sigma24 family protein